MRAHIVGGGIASFAAAAYLIRDGGVLANNIHVYEAGEHLGGALGMAGGPSSGYVLPTGRIFELQYRCTLELFSLVPAASDSTISIKDEIVAFNKRYGFHDKTRIIDRDRKIIRSSHFGRLAVQFIGFRAHEGSHLLGENRQCPVESAKLG